jgi:hypothetical protein
MKSLMVVWSVALVLAAFNLSGCASWPSQQAWNNASNSFSRAGANMNNPPPQLNMAWPNYPAQNPTFQYQYPVQPQQQSYPAAIPR